jgi:hypothetical protein
VCVWYTRNLSRIALRRNVGESAWGVALHKERRLLAVSANTHDITVFELGVEQMVRERKEQSDDEESRESGFRARTEELPADQRRKKKRHSRGESDEDPGRPGTSRSGGNGRKRRKEKPLVADRSIKILRGHENNIPNISFLDDASGRWLTSTDIDGVVTLWDVHTRRMVESCQLGPRQPRYDQNAIAWYPQYGEHILTESMSRGWSVIMLTPQSFKPMDDLHTALGIKSRRGIQPPAFLPRSGRRQSPHLGDIPPRTPLEGVKCVARGYYKGEFDQVRIKDIPRAWDISPEPEYNHFYRSFGREPEFIVEDDEEESPYELDEASEGATSDTEEPSPPQSPDPVIDPVPQIPTLPPGEGPDHYQGYSDTDTDSNDDSFSESYDESDDMPDTDNYGVNISPHESPSSYSTASSIPSSRPTYAAVAYSATIPYPPPSNDELDPAQPPLSYVFTTTEHNAYLLPTHRLSPTVFCREFVKILPPNNRQLEMIDRLNMVIHIPELSIIVSATQGGRAGIFRLTRVGEDCVMRLDYMLPRVAPNYARNVSRWAPPEQEEGYDIPHAIQWPLLGIAASPVQGKELGKSRAGSDVSSGARRRRDRQRGGGWRGIEGRRRWRLMMVYMNGTVLSYELGREREDEGVYGDGYGALGGDGFVMV